MVKVFIDGSAGTTGLRIADRLSERSDISLIKVDNDRRHDIDYRHDCMKEAEITFLCLPDDAAREAVSIASGTKTRIIDASTAHRTSPGWVYGFPELSKAHREALRDSVRTANPGCHASGAISLIYPLIASGLMPKDYPVAIHSLTGYSGGGKKMIADYENAERELSLSAPREYALTQRHKHLPEIKAICSLSHEPLFSPIVADYYSGMLVSVPIFTDLLTKKIGLSDILDIFHAHYDSSKLISVSGGTEGMLSSNALSGRDSMVITVNGNDDRVLLSACFDNLGKGASGAAVQCMNLMLGLPEETGLFL